MIDLLIVIALWCADTPDPAACKLKAMSCMNMEHRLPSPPKVLECLKPESRPSIP
jgi:hypothetical protein